MDIHTLVVCDLLFLALSAAMVLLYRFMHADLPSGAPGGNWFVASYLCLALTLLITLSGIPGKMHGATTVRVILVLAGHLLLHRALAEALEQKRALWNAQLAVLAIGGLAALGSFLGLTQHLWLNVHLLSGVQYTLTSWMLFRWSRRRGRLAGTVGGSIIAVYALCHFVWVYQAAHTGQLRDSFSGRVPPLLMLLSHISISFAYLLLSGLHLSSLLEREAQVDELTGLMNLRALRRAASRELTECCRKKGLLSVLMIDLDGLKKVNDRLGHGAGDVLLRAAAYALASSLREEDVLARIGGDEFCVLLPHTDLQEATLIAERCRRAVVNTDAWYGERLQTSASFGVAHFRNCEMSWEELLRQSDEALYQAKRSGRNRVIASEGAPRDALRFSNVLETGAF